MSVADGLATSRGAGAGVVVVGLGNPILSDDAVGLCVAREVAARVDPARIDVRESVRGGLDLVDLITGFREAHIVDAILSRDHRPGEILCFSADELPHSLTLASSHEVDLPTALELLARLGEPVPEAITIWAIAVLDPYTVSEELSPAVAAAVGPCAEQILEKTGGLPTRGGGRGAPLRTESG